MQGSGEDDVMEEDEGEEMDDGLKDDDGDDGDNVELGEEADPTRTEVRFSFLFVVWI